MKTILYTAPACPFCIIVKNYLKKNNVVFSELDISKDKEAEQEMQEKSGQTNVPVVDAGGKIIIGYDLKGLKEALGLQ